jgi:hypothetical protein
LIRSADASGQWHAQGPKSFVVTSALCGEALGGAVEVAPHDDTTSRDGRCSACEARIAEAERESSEAGAAAR